MKGNLVKELRKVVKNLYDEGHPEIFAFAILDKGDNVEIQLSDFSLDLENLSSDYISTYHQAKKVLMLAKSRRGDECKAINSIICNEGGEELWYNKGVLRVLNLCV